MDSLWKVELAEAYFNSWQSAHREVCRLETLIAEKDREIERLKETTIDVWIKVPKEDSDDSAMEDVT